MSRAAVVTGPPRSAAVAAGSADAVAAAVEVLRAGGSAVDAAVAAALATAMSEPVLSSLGGGGFLLHAPAGGDAEVLDFFVAVPGVGARDEVEPAVATVVVDFAKAGPAAAASEQVFHGGWGTVAVPGCFAGYLDAHRRWGRLPLPTVLAPAERLARQGVALSTVQRGFVTLTEDLLLLTADSRTLFASAVADGRYRNTAYADLLTAVAAGDVVGPQDPAYADALVSASRASGGLLTHDDLAGFAPVLRSPAQAWRSGVRIATNPAPASGGAIVLDALARLAPEPGRIDWATALGAQADAILAHRAPGQVPTGTTHISVVDAEGAIAALTTSNGSGSGTVVPGWGVPLNNMLGEEDLVPGAPLAPGERMGSMMSPTLLVSPDGSRIALGTGGSERIRSATLAVITRLVDGGADLESAITAPRLHVGGDHQVHVEPGLDEGTRAALTALAATRGWPAVEEWPTPNVYFGGVHAVRRAADGSVTAVGDARRGGAAAVVLPGGDVVAAGA